MTEEFNEEEMPRWAVDLQKQIAEVVERMALHEDEQKSKSDFTRFRERHGLAGDDDKQTPDNKDVKFKDIRKRLGLDE